MRDYLEQAPDVARELAANAQFRAAVDGLQMVYEDNAYFGHFARIARPETRLLAERARQYAMLGRAGFDFVRRFFASQEMALMLVFILRDPVARLWSHLRSLPCEGGDLLEDWPRLVRQRGVIMRSDYRQTIEAVDAVFPAEDVLYLFYEDLFRGDGLAQLCRFAGLQPRPGDTATRQNATSDPTDLLAEVGERLGALLAPQYRFCRERFGDAIPARWRR